MGARPVAAFVSLGLPRDLTVKRAPGFSWVDRFYNGLLALADDYKTPLAGGDLAESPLPLADIALVGAVRRGKALLRSEARIGDELYVTGCLGGAAAEFELLQKLAPQPRPGWVRTISNKMSDLLATHLYPRPRIAQGQWLQGKGVASAAIDLSDGLSTDLAHLCEESGVGAEVDAVALPLHPKASLDQALHGGEDYELLFTAPRSARVPREIAGVRVTRIGRMVRRKQRSPAVLLQTAGGAVHLAPKGWQHFS
jgi:thiamine-monophosphate kinase